MEPTCPACESSRLAIFHRQASVPANSCLLLDDEDEARRFPRGALTLAACHACGVICNVDFDPALTEYSGRYEETQAFSPRFTEFAASLARRWVDTYHLAGGTVLEIGSGKGEFLAHMADAGIGKGIGIDPAIDLDRLDHADHARLTWITDRFDDRWAQAAGAGIEPDAVVCRHTLEHIAPVAEFVSSIRRYIGDRGAVTLFELPDVQRVLDEVAFWDVYYEHCTYFTEGSLARLFERCGFAVIDIRREYDGQYLVLEARPVPAGVATPTWPVDDMPAILTGVERFRTGYAETVGAWRSRLEARTGDPVVIWGASSKGVAFLAEMGEHVAAAVDINPYKQGMYMAGTGHRVVAPAELVDIAPGLVVVMNPVYVEEITAELASLGVRSEVVAL